MGSKPKRIQAADLFCGAGGTSLGLSEACVELSYDLDLLAVNHWPIAISTHSRNHKFARHMCETLDSVDPRKVVPGGKLHLLVASPECTHHSNARGGRPMSDQSRASGWHVVRWAEALRIDSILVENVQEWLSWGPLDSKGRPMKSRRGETFQAWLKALESLGYRTEFRVLNAADYGDPTTRRRLFIMAQRRRRGVRWPVPTHSQDGAATLFGATERWRSARHHVIDWTKASRSIFLRPRPLAKATLRRAFKGLLRNADPEVRPYILRLYRPARRGVRPTFWPAEVLAAGPAVLVGQQSGGMPRSVDAPAPTVAAAGAIGLAEAVIIGAGGPARAGNARSVDEPLKTVQASDRCKAIVEPVIVPTNHGEADTRSHGIDKPMPTVTAFDAMGLAQAVVTSGGPERQPRSVDEPIGTVLGREHHAVTDVHLLTYHSNGGVRSLEQPLPAVTTRDRAAVLELLRSGKAVLDIRFRMLTPRELARAQGFPDDFEFEGTREQVVRQIGNAVPRHLAKALCKAALEDK